MPKLNFDLLTKQSQLQCPTHNTPRFLVSHCNQVFVGPRLKFCCGMKACDLLVKEIAQHQCWTDIQ